MRLPKARRPTGWRESATNSTRGVVKTASDMARKPYLIGLGTGLGFTAINIAALTGTRRGEEGLASGLINTSRQIGGPIGLAVLLTVANFETPTSTGHQLVQSAVAMVTGFGYAFFSHTANRDRNYLCGFTHTGKTSSSWGSGISDSSSELREL